MASYPGSPHSIRLCQGRLFFDFSHECVAHATSRGLSTAFIALLRTGSGTLSKSRIGKLFDFAVSAATINSPRPDRDAEDFAIVSSNGVKRNSRAHIPHLDGLIVCGRD
jgi:hypothetical protein